MIKLSAFSDEADNRLDGQIEALKRNGITYTELRNLDGKSVADLTEEEAKSVKARLDLAGIKVWSVGSPLGKVDVTCDFEAYKQKVRHVCKIAKILGADKIRMFSFFHAYDETEKVVTYLREMVAIANEYGVKMCHENEKDIYGDVVERVEELLEKVNGLYSVYDPANFLQCGETAQKSLNALHGKAEYFHIKDVIFETGELVPAGYGDGKIDELIARIDGDKVLSIEPHLAVFEGYAAIDDTEMKNKFHFESNAVAFDAAIQAIKDLLKKAGYQETKEGFVK